MRSHSVQGARLNQLTHILLIGSIQCSRSVVSDSSRPQELQHARPPCPSPTPGAFSNSCPSSWWCHPTISSSVIPFSSRLQSFPASGSFQMSRLSASWSKYWSFSFNISPSNEYSVLNIHLIGWWWGNWESASSTFWFQLIWVYMFVGSKQVKLFPLMGVSVSAKQLEDNVACVPWGGAKALPQGCTVLSSLFLPCLYVPALPWLAGVWTCPLELMEAWRLDETKKRGGTSLVVQRLRPHTPNEGGLGLISGQGTRHHMPRLKTPQATVKSKDPTRCN